MKSNKLTKRAFGTYYPLGLALICTVAVFIMLMLKTPLAEVLKGEMLKYKFLSLIITVEVTLFGFLLAVLAIVLQMNNKTIEFIKRADRFKELIDFNKAAVVSCFCVIIFTPVVIFFNKYCGNSIYSIIAFTLWVGVLVYNVSASYRFVNIFYTISS